MNVLERLSNCGIVPVVVIDDAKDAVLTANALLSGGVDVMEITLRTGAAIEAIRQVSQRCPETCVGAGTVLSIEQAKAAVDAGAKFIVSPGFDRGLVQWCIKNGLTVTPGCVTPSEITEALSLGVKVLKFFPANIYGGLQAMKALAGPFRGVKFIPTGGISDINLSEFVAAPFVHAVGGSWLCAKADIAAENFDKITRLSRESREVALGYAFAHLGINCSNYDSAMAVSKQFATTFGFDIKEGNSSSFASSYIEVMKSMYLGEHGHIAIRTANIARALADLAKKGFTADMDTAKYKDDTMISVYLKVNIGGFAVHLLQKYGGE